MGTTGNINASGVTKLTKTMGAMGKRRMETSLKAPTKGRVKTMTITIKQQEPGTNSWPDNWDSTKSSPYEFGLLAMARPVKQQESVGKPLWRWGDGERGQRINPLRR